MPARGWIALASLSCALAGCASPERAPERPAGAPARRRAQASQPAERPSRDETPAQRPERPERPGAPRADHAPQEHLLDLIAPVASARQALADHGLSLEAVYRGEVFSSLRGGVQRHDATAYRGLLTLGLTLDTAPLGLWEGGRLRLLFREGHGRGITEQVGDVQVLSNLDARPLTQLSAIWYRQSFLDERVWLQVGKQDANARFAASSQAGAFIHSSAGYPPTIPLPSYPEPEWGALAGLEPWDWLSLQAAVFQGQPDGDRSLGESFARLRGPIALGALALEWELLGRDGRLELGGWWNGARAERPDGRGTHGGAGGGWAILDHWLWRLSDDDDQPARGIGLFAQYGWAPPDRSPLAHYLGGGIRLHGPFPGRERDQLGLALYQVRFSAGHPAPHTTETALELLYVLQLTGWLSLKLDLQTIAHPGGSDVAPALVAGLRCVLDL